MRPLYLRMKGFRGYTDQELDLSGTTSVLITGPTGSGKSSIPGAILLALTGENGSSDPNGHIKEGCDLGQVEYHFEHGGSTYRIVHIDSLKTSRKKTDRQFAVSDGNGGWIPKGGKSLAETNAEILRVIGQSYNELTCGPFALQDQASRFLDPGEMRIDGKVYSGRSARLQVAVKMLGLSRYEDLRRLATEQARDLDGKADTLEAQVAAADSTLTDRPDAEFALSQAEATIQTARQVAQEAQGLIEALTGQIGTYQAEIEAGRLQCVGLAVDQKALADLRASQHAKEATRTRYRGILDHRAEIEAKAAESEALGKQAEALRVELAGIEAEIRGLEAQKAPAEARLKTARGNQVGIQARLADIRKRLAKRGEQETKIKLLTAARTDREAVGAGIQATDEQIVSARANRDTVTASNAEAQRKRGEILAEEKKVKAQASGLLPLIQGNEGRIAVLGTVPCIGVDDLADRCPLLDDARRSRDSLHELKAKHVHLCAWQRPALPELQPTDDLDATLRTLTAQKAQQQGRLVALESEIRTLTPAEAEFASLTTLAGEVPRLEAEEQATRTEVDAFIAEVTRLEVETAAHRGGALTTLANLSGVEADIRGHARWTSLPPEIALAERELPVLEADLDRIGGQIVALTERIEEAGAVQAGLAVKENALAKYRGDLDGQRTMAARYRADESVATDAAAQHRATLASLEKLAGEREAAATEAADLRSQHTRLLALVDFYRQAPIMIMENTAIPVLEEETNRFLSRVAANRMSVRIETQREVKSRDTLADGLEIFIRDWRGERSFDDFSGGQRFELALAFRVAWARLQERRAGAGIDCLFVDEGFSSLSPGDLEAVMNALRKLEGQFSFFAVISHVEELKNLFPTRIEVRGGDTDSVATLMRG